MSGFSQTDTNIQINTTNDMDTNELDIVRNALNQSRDCGLDVEVVAWALQCMKEDPALSIGEAIELGFWEWAK